MDAVFDVAVIGGGINGCGIAADAALRGLSVLLVQEDDFAAHTSSASTKLIHGGLRYLENFEFSLVKKALEERQILSEIAPHLITPLPIVMPVSPKVRSTFRIQCGLFLYDHLSLHNTFPKSHRITRHHQQTYLTPLASAYQKAFLFYDAMTDDARLTLANALQAKQYGAVLHRNTILENATINQNKRFELHLKNSDGQQWHVKAKVLVNATGAFVNALQKKLSFPERPMTWVKGCHLIVPKLYTGSHAYLLQLPDKRIIFVIPFHGYTMIGTTEKSLSDPELHPTVDPDEINYLLKAVGQYFKKQLSKKNILHQFSGVRTLLLEEKAPKDLSRDYEIDFLKMPAPILTIYGGKITTYRRLAKEAIDKLRPIFTSLPDSLTHITPLPGAVAYRNFLQEAPERYAWLPPTLLSRFLKSYGTQTEMLLKHTEKLSHLGDTFGEGLYEQEIHYLKENEWAKTAEDILWRRTKLGLRFTETMRNDLEKYLTEE